MEIIKQFIDGLVDIVTILALVALVSFVVGYAVTGGVLRALKKKDTPN